MGENQVELIWLIFDYLGTIAFALSGVLVGMQRRMDIFGIAMLALATAVGGGMIRDTLVGNVPPAALKNPVYISISLLTTILLFTVYRTPVAVKHDEISCGFVFIIWQIHLVWLPLP